MKRNSGFTLIEFLVAIVIATVIGMLVAFFARNVINLNFSSSSSMTSMLEGRKILSVMVNELRGAAPSALGSYAIESASTSTIVFFTDVNSDGVSDRIRYFIDYPTKSVKRGVVLATGEPPAYNLGDESLNTLVTDVSNATSTPLFDYYDGSYVGTSTPLSLPILLLDIRLIKITVRIEKDSNQAPIPTTVSSQASLRNLKDNL
ncbi:MAG: prepilin-type N-terminal cleavage/methylation domain-containing protein [Candidatus Zambryskibacteria bacterium]|nr:prepilin-type N-terminal cleavage/methylation domain-containing protein [Candidatus Zambryskibacteria bacterium]